MPYLPVRPCQDYLTGRLAPKLEKGRNSANQQKAHCSAFHPRRAATPAFAAIPRSPERSAQPPPADQHAAGSRLPRSAGWQPRSGRAAASRSHPPVRGLPCCRCRLLGPDGGQSPAPGRLMKPGRSRFRVFSFDRPVNFHYNPISEPRYKGLHAEVVLCRSLAKARRIQQSSGRMRTRRGEP